MVVDDEMEAGSERLHRNLRTVLLLVVALGVVVIAVTVVVVSQRKSPRYTPAQQEVYNACKHQVGVDQVNRILGSEPELTDHQIDVRYAECDREALSSP